MKFWIEIVTPYHLRLKKSSHKLRVKNQIYFEGVNLTLAYGTKVKVRSLVLGLN